MPISLLQLILFLVGLLILAWLGVATRLRTLFSRLRQVELVAIDPAEPEYARRLALTRQHQPWATAHGFTYCGCYIANAMDSFIAAWQHEQPKATFLVLYVVQGQIAMEFTTEFADNVSVDTSGSHDSGRMPKPPGAYAQAFHGATLDTLWQRHEEACQYLLCHGGARYLATPHPFEQLFVEGTRYGAQFILRIPLWWARLPYWHFLRRRRWANVSLEEQHRRGWIRLPNELRFG